MFLERTAEEVIKADRYEDAGEARNVKGLNTIDANGVDSFGVVAVHHCAALPGPPPHIALADGELRPPDMVRPVRIFNAEVVARLHKGIVAGIVDLELLVLDDL